MNNTVFLSPLTPKYVGIKLKPFMFQVMIYACRQSLPKNKPILEEVTNQEISKRIRSCDFRQKVYYCFQFNKKKLKLLAKKKKKEDFGI